MVRNCRGPQAGQRRGRSGRHAQRQSPAQSGTAAATVRTAAIVAIVLFAGAGGISVADERRLAVQRAAARLALRGRRLGRNRVLVVTVDAGIRMRGRQWHAAQQQAEAQQNLAQVAHRGSHRSDSVARAGRVVQIGPGWPHHRSKARCPASDGQAVLIQGLPRPHNDPLAAGVQDRVCAGPDPTGLPRLEFAISGAGGERSWRCEPRLVRFPAVK